MIEINLFEEKKSIQMQAFEYLKHLNWKLTIVAVIFFKIPEIATNIYFKNELGKFREEKDRLNALVVQHEEYVEKNKEVKEQVKILNDKIADLKVKIEQIDKIAKKKKNPFHPLESIIYIIPENLWLTELIVKNGTNISIKGMAREYKYINSFKSNLNRAPFFENSFVLDQVNTVDKNAVNSTGANVKPDPGIPRDESFAFTGKIIRFEL